MINEKCKFKYDSWLIVIEFLKKMNCWIIYIQIRIIRLI